MDVGKCRVGACGFDLLEAKLVHVTSSHRCKEIRVLCPTKCVVNTGDRVKALAWAPVHVWLAHLKL